MFNRNKVWRAFSCFIALTIILSANWAFSQAPVAVLAAQSTGDSLPTRTPTLISPSATAPAVATQAPAIWIGRLVDRTFGFTNGGGSIFRVSVQGVVDTPIELRSDDQFIVANSGTKPEIGPYAAEFAPVTEGTWTVTVPSLDVSLTVSVDNYSLVTIEFVEVAEAEATQAAVTPATPTPPGNRAWEGEITSEVIGAGGPFARLLIKVLEREAQPVQLSTLSQVINTANTGQKADELGPNTVEFAGLTPGKYIVEPLGLNISLEVELKPDIVTYVEFRPQAAPATPTPTATVEATLTPIGAIATTAPPLPATPTSPPPPTPTVPKPSPVPISRWLGVIDERAEAGLEPSSIMVKVDNLDQVPVRLRSAPDGSLVDRRCTTGQGGGLGDDACAFTEVEPGRYVVEPEGFALSLPVVVYEHETVRVRFFDQELAPGIVGWQAEITKNSNGFAADPQADAKIRMRADDGPAGLVIALNSVQGPSRYCELAPAPDLGSLVCEFGRLRAGVYRVVAETTGASQRLFVDGHGLAEISLAPNATLDTVAQTLAAPVVGYGAQPRPAAPLPTTAPVTQVVAQLPTAVPFPTIPLTPTVVMTPTPAFAWQARVVETGFSGAGAIGVRVVDVKNQPVLLKSGDWQSQPQLTGAKPELGNYAVEFGGLAQGEYTIELVDLTEYRVELQPGQFVLVEFDYVAVQ
ncbi:MAG: hypothetical protein H6631_08705 [Anaerolineaceae bacterium]|nr:hypothetical protein [Anaerolineaceae bacterium]